MSTCEVRSGTRWLRFGWFRFSMLRRIDGVFCNTAPFELHVRGRWNQHRICFLPSTILQEGVREPTEKCAWVDAGSSVVLQVRGKATASVGGAEWNKMIDRNAHRG